MLDKIKEDQFWNGAVILLYALPFFLWISTSMNYMGSSKSWLLFGAGLLMVMIGSVAMILLRRPTEVNVVEISKPSEPVPNVELVRAEPIPQQPNPEIGVLQQKVQEHAEELHKFQEENVALKNQNFQVIHAYNSLKKEVEELNSRSNGPDTETLLLIDDQREVIRQYEGRMLELENHIEDLKYEMRAILNLSEDSDSTRLSEDEILRSVSNQ